MITGVEIVLCNLDDKPISESEVYEFIKSEHGQEIADQFTYNYCIEFGSDELKEAISIVTGGYPVGIAKEESA